MKFNLKIKNFGKLTDETIEIGNFTVFAGPNNTGKSFVSKLLYSIFDAMNANHVAVQSDILMEPIFSNLRRLGRHFPKDDRRDEIPTVANIRAMLKHIQEIEEIAQSYNENEYEAEFGDFQNLLSDMLNVANKMQDKANYIKQAFEELEKSEGAEQKALLQDKWKIAEEHVEYMKQMFQEVSQGINALQEALHGDPALFIATSIEHKIRENLIQNFQVPTLSELRGIEDTPSKIDIENLGEFKFSNGEIEFEIGNPGLPQLQHLSNVIYLESPIYSKLKNALEIMRINPRRRYSHRTRLSGIPEYFYDLMNSIRYDYTGDMAFPDLYEKLTGKDVLGGKLVISETGELLFRENERNFSLHVTATGIANLGMLALLIERKILDEGSFLFIDEPEAHLHTEWHVIMVKALFELAKGGVNVVIATHSAENLKFIEVEVKKNPEYEKWVALNHFSHQGVIDGESDFDIKLANIKKELTKPFSDLYIKGLL